ncbi:MAG: hypothetical protein K1X75_03225 [Leptospirales bacterium]|nr:hypothetical protein [Leptospirales bacterium]
MSFFSRLFQRRPRKDAPAPLAPADERLDLALRRVRERLARLLQTRSRASGEIKKTPQYTLTKSNPGLFRLEAEGLNLLINTEPFLLEKDGRVQGLLRMSELALCRALEGKDLAEFFRRAERPGEHSIALFRRLSGAGPAGDPDQLPALDEAAEWSGGDLDQLLMHISPNILAHGLAHAAPGAEAALRARLSDRRKQESIEELERLLSPGANRELNPHSRVRSLAEFEDALRDFRVAMRQVAEELQFRRRREADLAARKA